MALVTGNSRASSAHTALRREAIETEHRTAEHRVLDAAKVCSERWGMSKVTVDDIATEAGISRATLYRLFPGGKDVLFDALRARENREFFEELDAHINGATSYDDLLVRIVVEATRQLRADEHLQLMLASEPGEVLASLSFEGLPRIVVVATGFLRPRVAPFIGDDRSAELAEWLTRVVLTYFLTPSQHVDLGDPDSARRFVESFVLPAFPPTANPFAGPALPAPGPTTTSSPARPVPDITAPER